MKQELTIIEIMISVTDVIILSRINAGDIEFFFDWESLGRRNPQYTIKGHGKLYKELKKLIGK